MFATSRGAPDKVHESIPSAPPRKYRVKKLKPDERILDQDTALSVHCAREREIHSENSNRGVNSSSCAHCARERDIHTRDHGWAQAQRHTMTLKDMRIASISHIYTWEHEAAYIALYARRDGGMRAWALETVPPHYR